jgi:hypothetical protein
MDYRASQRQPLAALAGRCGPVMTGKGTLRLLENAGAARYHGGTPQ